MAFIDGVEFKALTASGPMALDGCTDVWSLGVMIYEMVAGQMPFRGEFDQAIMPAALSSGQGAREPWSSRVHYQLALLFQEQGKLDQAREHIEKAMKVWEHADPGHRDANRARELAKALRSSS